MRLFSDATIVTETPPLRAMWAKRGEQARVPISGNRHRRVLYGALNPDSGDICLDKALRWDQGSFQAHLRHIRSKWRGWNIVLFLDRGTPHTAKRSQRLAQELGVELRWLPVACPELNPVEGLWREVKGQVLANEPTPDVAQSVERACRHLEEMSPIERLQVSGALSEHFWLAT